MADTLKPNETQKKNQLDDLLDSHGLVNTDKRNMLEDLTSNLISKPNNKAKLMYEVAACISAAVDAVAGGMHTVVLDKDGDVWTFGCNYHGSLGRVVEEEEECFLPGKVPLPEKMVMLSAGDSHTAALSQSGQVTVTVSLSHRSPLEWSTLIDRDRRDMVL